MQRGVLVALAALLANICAAAAADNGSDDRHRLYDRGTDCAVYDTTGFPAQKANWDGPCTRGVASGRGTATYVDRRGVSETLSAEFVDGAVVDGRTEIAWSDGAHYSGLAMDGKPDGEGVLVDAKGNRFDGEWKNGALNGHGTVVWANGDRYEGDWVAGKAEGHGVQLWADGQKYEGLWHNDQPNGQGTLTRRDGTRVAGTFVDGKLQVAEGPLPVQPGPRAAVASAAPTALLDTFVGRTLTGVDGSTVAFTAGDESILRTVTAPDGVVQRTAFVFLGKGLGTVSDVGNPPQVTGVFRTTPDGIVAEYADGHLETLAPLGDGIAISLKTSAGEQACAAWYPQGHQFSTDERQAAVAAYARRLGVPDAPATGHSSCTIAAATPLNERHAPPPAGRRHKPGHPQATSLALPVAPPGGLQAVPVKASTVHLIDAAPAPDSIDTATQSVNVDEPIASNCLKIDSDGSDWGFRNHCGYAVQFAYCLLHGINEMTACGANGAVSVPGSVSANGFSALFGDDSLAERDVEHNFRWVGCKGGAGEVAAHLDAIEPASGHCVRAGRTLAQGN